MNTKIESKQLLGEGGSAGVYKLGDGKVLKLFKETTSIEAVRHEYNNVLKLNGKGLPMPRAYDMVEQDGRPAIIYEYVAGTTMNKLLSSRPWKMKLVAAWMAELHKAVDIPIDAELAGVKDYLRYRIPIADMLTKEEKEKILSYLDRLPDGNVLCHGDFHFNNILVKDDKAAVIDWMDAAKGCQFFDVARTWITIEHADLPQNMNSLLKALARRGNRKISKNYLSHYIEITRCKKEQITEWVLPAAAARLSEGISVEVKKEIYVLVKKLLIDC